MVVLIIITMYLPTLFVTVLELVGESSWSHVTVLLECSFFSSVLPVQTASTLLSGQKTRLLAVSTQFRATTSTQHPSNSRTQPQRSLRDEKRSVTHCTTHCSREH